MTLRLNNTTAAEVAAAIHTVYPDSNPELKVDATSNSLMLVADRSTADRIQSLVSILDAELPESTPPVDKPAP